MNEEEREKDNDKNLHLFNQTYISFGVFND